MHGGTDVRTISTSNRGSVDRKWAGKKKNTHCNAVQVKEVFFFLLVRVESGGVASPNQTVLRRVGRWVVGGEVRWVGVGGLGGCC